MKPRIDSSLMLRDGRRLAYAEWGDPDGRPILFFHGTPSGRLLHHPDPAALEGLGARWVTVDRPGFGGSTFLPRRSLLDWPGDVAALADHLGLAKFSVVGLSGGGPHALACAHSLPDRVCRTAVVSGIGRLTPETLRQLYPERRLGIRLSRWVPWMMPLVIRLKSNPRDVERHFAKVLAQCPNDRTVLERPGMREMFMANWADANRQGVRAFAAEGRIFALPWPFEPSAIVGVVRFWHGSGDESIPLSMAQSLSETIPGATLEIIPGAGHFLLFDRFGEIVRWAAGDEG